MGVDWLGLEPIDDHRWSLVVSEGVVAGSGSLYGGCASAAALVVAAAGVAEHEPRWAATHFVGLARLGTEVHLVREVISAGRTLTHVGVTAVAEGRPCFATRATFGARPDLVRARFVQPPQVGPPEQAAPFDLPTHAGTWAERFEWRLVGPTDAEPGTASWWVRSRDPGLAGPALSVVLGDYLTYGIGRGAGVLVGGLSVDNELRFHSAATDAGGWMLLEVRAEHLDGGFGSGTARIWTEQGDPVCTASQCLVLNEWDWRLPSERDG